MTAYNDRSDELREMYASETDDLLAEMFNGARAGGRRGRSKHVKRTFRSVIRPTNNSEMGHHHPRWGSPHIAQALH